MVPKQLMVPIDFHSISFPIIDEDQQLFVQNVANIPIKLWKCIFLNVL